MRLMLMTVMLYALSLKPVLAAQDTGPEGKGPAQPALSEVTPICSPDHEGRLSCQANRVCICDYEQAVPARGLPDRWLWDCSITRPQCEQPPADGGEYLDPAQWPLIIDRRDRGDRKMKDRGHDRKSRTPHNPG